MDEKFREDHVAISDMASTMMDNNPYEDLDGISDNSLNPVSAKSFNLPSNQTPMDEAELVLKRHKNSEISSSQYGINIFVIGFLLMFLCSFDIAGVRKCDWMIFLVVLVLIQILWMLWYIYVSHACTQKQKEKDSNAGARWLRCGIAIFAITTLIMDFLKLGHFVGYMECMPLIEGIYPAAHIVHTIVQVYFLWYHSKDVIKSFKTVERFGLIHSVFTNLLLWVSAVTTESKHQLEEHMARLTSLGFNNITLDPGHPHCNCTTGMCDAFSIGTYYVYPFNIEYHILASAMLYVLWKNIGRSIKHRHHKTNLKFQGVVVGVIFGLIVLAVTIGVVVLYLLNIGRSKQSSEAALTVYYLYSVVVLSGMCIAAVVGLILHRLDRHPAVVEKSPSLKLDEELLVGSACGSWITSWGSILAVIYAESHPTYTWYNLPYSILVLIEKYIQNLFIITYIHRKDEKICTDTIPNIYMKQPQLASSDDNNHVGPCGGPDVRENGSLSNNNNVDKKEKEENNSIPAFDHMPSNNTNPGNGGLKKQVLRNITVALFISNISLWIPPAFGCRPQYDNGLEAVVFGLIPWIFIIDIALPFSIFYRMHSAYSLFDVYCKI
ncbi:proton channel OTOP1-like [Pelobates fuscus]|uniref:proton channel OTOP1-like n=2 Tax=Pelobates fuscus TaxID=191477 RepID=UPI002FE4504C